MKRLNNTLKILGIAIFLFVCSGTVTGQGTCNGCLSISNTAKDLRISYGPYTKHCFLVGYRSYQVKVYVDGVLLKTDGNKQHGDEPHPKFYFNKNMTNEQTGKTYKIKVEEYETDPCSGAIKSLVRRTEREYFMPFRYDLNFGADNFLITGGLTPYCNSKLKMYEGSPSEATVKRDLVNQEDSYFVMSKHSTNGYPFRVYFPANRFSRVVQETGSINKVESRKEIAIIGGDNNLIRTDIHHASLYLNAANNYCRLYILKFYNKSNRNKIDYTVVIPTFVYGEQTNYLGETTGPILPQAILHNPPGDNSYTYLERNTSLCSEVSMGYASGSGVDASVGLKVEAGGDVGVASVSASVKATVSANESSNNNRSGSTSVCYETTDRYQNNHSDLGLDGDLVIASATTYDYGTSVKLNYKNCKVVVSNKKIVLRPKGLITYTRSQGEIKEKMIELRNSLGSLSSNTQRYRIIEEEYNNWNDIVTKNENQFNTAPQIEDFTFGDGGAQNPRESSQQVSRTSTYTVESTLFFEESLLVEAGVEVGGGGASVGVEGSVGIKFNSEVSKGNSNTNNSSKLIGYYLEDSTDGDKFHVKVKQDAFFGAHYFDLQADSRTSCPFEGGQKRNQPLLTIGDARTSRADFRNNPIGEPVFINLNVCNNSSETRTYRLRAKRPNGAVITESGRVLYSDGQGVSPAISDIAPGACELIEIKVEAQNAARLSYENIILELIDNCSSGTGDANAASEAILNVYFKEVTPDLSTYFNFRVDMRNQEVSSQGVFVAGTWQSEAGYGNDWMPGVAQLTDADGDGIYTGRFKVENFSDSKVLYKFINGDIWEDIPSDCGEDLDGYLNRSFEMPSNVQNNAELNFGTFCFNECAECITTCPNGNLAQTNGLIGIYYHDMTLTNEAFKRVDQEINFNWVGDAPANCMEVDQYSIAWEGYIVADYTENYTFYTTTDDGVRLWIDDQLIVDQWRNQAAREWFGNINLQAGKPVSIRMEYFENGGAASAKLSWSSTSIAKSIVPSGNLYTEKIEEKYIRVTPDNQTVSSEAGEVVFSVEANIGWTVTVEEKEWAIYHVESIVSTGSLTLIYESNETNQDRSITATFTAADGTTIERILTQKGAEANNINFCDDFESYDFGYLSPQSNRWSKWSSNASDAQVVDSGNGNKAMYINHNPALGNNQADVLLGLNDLNIGKYDLKWHMAVFQDKTAYFNTQKIASVPGQEFGFQITFENGTATVETGGGAGDFSYPQQQWFEIRLLFDFDNDNVVLYLNGMGIYQWAISNTVRTKNGMLQLGAVNFYAIQNANFLIDNICVSKLENITSEVEGRSTVSALTDNNPNAIVKSIVRTSEIALGKNYPNPASKSTAIPMTIPVETQVAYLDIVDISGRLVQRLSIEDRGELIQELSLNLETGIYFYSLLVDGVHIDTQRIVVVK